MESATEIENKSGDVSSNEITKEIPTIEYDSTDGEKFLWGDDYHLIINELAKKYGNIYQVNTGVTTLVVISGHQYVKEALLNQSDIFNSRANFKILNIRPQRHFLELETGPTWRLHRKTFTAAMADYFRGRWNDVESWITVEINEIVDRWLIRDKKAFDPNRDISLCIGSFLQNVMFSRRFDSDDRANFDEKSLHWLPNGFINSTRYEVTVSDNKDKYYKRYGDIIDKFSYNMDGLDNYVSSNVADRKKTYKDGVLRDLCDFLFKANDSVPEQDKKATSLGEKELVVGSLSQVAGAGGGVGAFAIRWALLYMASFPECQKKVHLEMDAILKEGRAPTLDDKDSLPYTRACIGEILRHCSLTSIPAANYATTKDNVFDGYFIPGKTPLVINNYSLTRDSTVWSSPDDFNPNRFLNEDGSFSKVKDAQSFPFGLGPRKCLGEYFGRMIIYSLFAQLMYKFEFSLPENSEINLKAISGVFLVPEKGDIVVKSRNYTS